MRALTVQPGIANSARVVDVPEPDPSEGEVLVKGLAVGICGTDLEILAGEYGESPPGADSLVLGHESLGEVIEDPSGTFQPGDLVVGVVRHPDPVPCYSCAAGEQDMCRNGRYTEHGIKGRHGFARERYRLMPDFAVKLDANLRQVGMLVEPLSVLAKAWDHIERIGARATFKPRTALVTGAGPIGLAAALLANRRGLEVHVLDRVESGPKPDLVRALGAKYHHDGLDKIGILPDIVVECTGVASILIDVVSRNAVGSIVCLTGVSSPRTVELDAGSLNRQLVLENDVIFGSVNANRRHYAQAADVLATTDRSWLEALITRREPLANFQDAVVRREDDVKVIIEL